LTNTATLTHHNELMFDGKRYRLIDFNLAVAKLMIIDKDEVHEFVHESGRVERMIFGTSEEDWNDIADCAIVKRTGIKGFLEVKNLVSNFYVEEYIFEAIAIEISDSENDIK